MYKNNKTNVLLYKLLNSELVKKLLIMFFIAHGFAHLIGTFIYWKIMPGTEEVPYKTTIFFNSFEIGTLGVRLLGFCYLILAILFILFGIALLFQKLTFNSNTIFIVVLFSLLITFIDLQPAYIGFIINVFYLLLSLISKKLNTKE